jgi:drug/metabolite transporter (DMT)-like permease
MSQRAWVLFVAISLLWGLPYLLIKVAIAEVEPAIIVFARVVVSAGVLLPLALAQGALGQVARRWRTVLALSVLEIALPFLLIAYGEQHITSSLAALLIAADPLFIVLLALRFDPSERASGTRLLGLVLGLAGVGELVGLNVGGDALGVLGAAMVLLAAVCYALSALLVKRLSDVPLLGSVAVTLGVASLVLAPLGLLHLPARLPSGPTIASLLVLGTVCTALAYIIYYSLIAAAGATRASLITYVNPAVAVVLGVLVLSEPLTPGILVGFALILLGCALSTGAGRFWPRPAGRDVYPGSSGRRVRGVLSPGRRDG